MAWDGGRDGAGAPEWREVETDCAVAAAVSPGTELGVQLQDVGAALVPPLVQVSVVIVQQGLAAAADLGQQLIGAGGAVEAADSLLGQAGLAHDGFDALALARSAWTWSYRCRV